MFVVVDMSRAMEEADLKPSRLACSVKVLYISLSLAEFYVQEWIYRCRGGGCREYTPLSEMTLIVNFVHLTSRLCYSLVVLNPSLS